MKYAVAYGGKRPYLIERMHDTRSGAEDELALEGIKEGTRNDVRIVHILSHEEAKRKAVATALLKLAERWEDLAADDREGNGLRMAAEDAREEAELLWPALFHAGDGELPRSKGDEKLSTGRVVEAERSNG